MKKLVRSLNNAFMMIILTFFYFLIIGVAFVIYKLAHRAQKDSTSYWKEGKGVLPRDYYQSPY